MTHVEFVPNDRVIWQSDTAKTYQCPFCLRPIFSQHKGDDLPTVTCFGVQAGHRLTWNTETDTHKHP